jgi:hypothetical protein
LLPLLVSGRECVEGEGVRRSEVEDGEVVRLNLYRRAGTLSSGRPSHGWSLLKTKIQESHTFVYNYSLIVGYLRAKS